MSFYTRWQGCHVHAECNMHISSLHVIYHLDVMLYTIECVRKTDTCMYRLLHMMQYFSVMLRAAGKVHTADTHVHRSLHLGQQFECDAFCSWCWAQDRYMHVQAPAYGSVVKYDDACSLKCAQNRYMHVEGPAMMANLSQANKKLLIRRPICSHGLTISDRWV